MRATSPVTARAPHTFHIPVMGTGFTADTPLKVARFGITSVVPLSDDHLLEDLRERLCRREGLDYRPIPAASADSRARRITAYLDLLDELVSRQVEKMKREPFDGRSDLAAYFELLPDGSPLRQDYRRMLSAENPDERGRLQALLREKVRPGDLDVNIMTKLDRDTFLDGAPRPHGQSDALAALRGFALSRVSSAVVFSAGLNLKLCSYAAEFPDFFPDARGSLKKRITLKVSDFRSAQTQGKVFAKKGLWVSEYRIESGLNCGGHAFATAGELLGPILEEFRRKRSELVGTLFDSWRKALRARGGMDPDRPPAVRVTAQGGIGTAEEDRLLRERFGLDGTGWGSPFLLVPEATTVDRDTLLRLAEAGEKDIYLSGSSPLGVAFYNLRDSASERLRLERIAAKKPGSPCPYGAVAFNREFPGLPLCTASHAYQKKKLEQLKEKNPEPEEFSREYERIVEKSCICRDLGAGARKEYGLGGPAPLAPAICPGPNLAYFFKICSLREMVDHIYGRRSLPLRPSRSHQFVNELKIYMAYLKKRVAEARSGIGEKERAHFAEFKTNLLAGMDYYLALSREHLRGLADQVEDFREEILAVRRELEAFSLEHAAVFQA